MSDYVYKHYIRVDKNSNIIHGFSTAFEQPQDGDICINEQGGYQFRLFPDGEENPYIKDFEMAYNYRFIDGEVLKIPDDEKVYPEQQSYINPLSQMRADVDYIAIMSGVEL